MKQSIKQPERLKPYVSYKINIIIIFITDI